jgi:hypothetical protein
MDFENYFYRQARNALDQTDLLQCFGSTTLTTLQATIVLAQYETQHAMFDRAWLTMCRVSWLIDAARLEDQESGANSMTTHDPGTISAVGKQGALYPSYAWAGVRLGCEDGTRYEGRPQ